MLSGGLLQCVALRVSRTCTRRSPITFSRDLPNHSQFHPTPPQKTCSLPTRSGETYFGKNEARWLRRSSPCQTCRRRQMRQRVRDWEGWCDLYIQSQCLWLGTRERSDQNMTHRAERASSTSSISVGEELCCWWWFLRFFLDEDRWREPPLPLDLFCFDLEDDRCLERGSGNATSRLSSPHAFGGGGAPKSRPASLCCCKAEVHKWVSERLLPLL